MYNVKWLARVALDGLSDLRPAVAQAFNDNPDDDRLELIYGQSPRRNILLLAIAGIIAGEIWGSLIPTFPYAEYVNWSAVFLGAVHAILIRRYLFNTQHAGEHDFPWIAASLAPCMGLLMIGTLIATLVTGPDVAKPGVMDWIGTLLVALTHALGVAASIVIAVAALCFNRDWPKALIDLAVKLMVFRIMVWVTTLVMLEIGIIGPIVSRLLQGILPFQIPEWIPELIDQISYAGLMGVFYLAVIGATWIACRRLFGELLATGDVNILEAVAQMATDPEALKKKAAKKHQKEIKAQEKAQEKARKKAGKKAGKN
ncbi:MAG: hypothetical protein AB8G16_13360 [Gammaproteobacteria bacterium]